MRIGGVNIPDEKPVAVALTYLYGLGRKSSGIVLAEAKVAPTKRTKELTAEEVGRIQGVIEKTFRIEGELRQLVRQNIQRLKDIKAYRGLRHQRNLPVRGQRTRTNSRTVRGNVRKTAGSGKRKVDLK
ncbi:MAG: 30S ribosomal protein S13 [Candidatus Liptonbacteria bacterium]|nr:30S ribosomal protein S13 [Candidatus Liptonbacteria bacterium]